jgi:hypothetical protein
MKNINKNNYWQIIIQKIKQTKIKKDKKKKKKKRNSFKNENV